ncbi:hypothetical protein AK830_g9975 [Neonectria ditissima]|uniref:Uncharacterized protein n=1 Tax=Neonectria ditissima TaxID=78410 RepID=A0A0P7AGU8_9HYPO|nr:hypothetical protein AK830_g9975 [Neonectria ditissima]
MTRLNSRRRKKLRRRQKALQEACENSENQSAQVTGDALGSGDVQAFGDTAGSGGAPTSTVTLPAKDPEKPYKSGEGAAPQQPGIPEPKRRNRCKRPDLRDREYYRRVDSLDARYLGFQRRTQGWLDKKLREGVSEVSKWKRRIEKALLDLDRGTDRFAKLERREILVRVEALECRHEELLNKFAMLKMEMRVCQSYASGVQSCSSDLHRLLVRFFPQISEALKALGHIAPPARDE